MLNQQFLSHRRRLFKFSLLLTLCLGLQGIAQASLLVTPTRAQFEDRTRSQQITLVNRADKTTTYRISFLQLRMKTDGSYQQIIEAQAGEQFVDKMIRYSPRQITLKPNETQTVRLMLRKPKSLADGEYRSHLLFKEVAPADLGANIEKTAQKDSGGMSMQLIPLSAVSIPVIVKQGKLTASSEISQISLKSAAVPVDAEQAQQSTPEQAAPEQEAPESKQQTVASFELLRQGRASVYGDLYVNFTPAGGGESYQIGITKGISVLYPSTRRDIAINLTQLPDGVKLQQGRLDIIYQQRPEDGEATWAQASLILP